MPSGKRLKVETMSGEKKRRGRPAAFSEEVAARICARISMGETLRAICRDEGMPNRSTVAKWVVEDVAGFASQYARAREMGFDAMAEEALAIADTPVEGVRREESENGVKEVREDMLGHRKLQVDARKWLLSKWSPKKYGDRQEIDLNVSGSLAERLARAKKRADGDA